MGALPEWYRVVKAAQYLNVRPWELAHQPLYWVLVAEAGQAADAALEKHQAEKAKREKG